MRPHKTIKMCLRGRLVDLKRLLQATGVIVSISLSAFVMSSLVPAGVQAVSSSYKIIIERNPFDPKRGQDKTTVEGGAVSSDASELKKKYSVYGVIIAGNTRYAFIKPLKKTGRKDKESFRKVATGDLIDGWKVKDILDQGVLVVSGTEEVLLGVFETPKKERRSEKPVGLATPKPSSNTPKVGDKNRAKRKSSTSRGEHLVYPSGNKKDGHKIKNPFLEALKRAKNK